MAKHTSGPYEDYFEGSTIIVGDAATHTDLAEFFYDGEHTVSTSRDEAEANARLFMAAPDLLLALKCMEEEMSDYMRINKLGDPGEKHNIRLARAAIERAGATNSGNAPREELPDNGPTDPWQTSAGRAEGKS